MVLIHKKSFLHTEISFLRYTLCTLKKSQVYNFTGDLFRSSRTEDTRFYFSLNLAQRIVDNRTFNRIFRIQPSIYKHPASPVQPSNSFAHGFNPVHAASDIKTIGRCRAFRPPFKICKYTSEVRIYSSVSNGAEETRASASVQRREPFAAAAKWKNGLSFVVVGEEGNGRMPREGLA